MTGHKEIRTRRIFAPAKINLYLHVTGRRDQGYHELDSLIAFADIGDTIMIEPSPDLKFFIGGPFGNALQGQDILSTPQSSNLVIKALWLICREIGRTPEIRIGLDKILPIASGMGGGSADAAALVWGILDLWDIHLPHAQIESLLLSLGADVPVCYRAQSARIQGIGEIVSPLLDLAEMPVLLVNPGKPCLTKNIFKRYQGPFRSPITIPSGLSHPDNLIKFLELQNNDLEPYAQEEVPEIRNILNALRIMPGIQIARLSGSGATCFGLFSSEIQTKDAAITIAKENPDWWVKAGWLGRSARY